jgi:uncharacterized membrane protein
VAGGGLWGGGDSVGAGCGGWFGVTVVAYLGAYTIVDAIRREAVGGGWSVGLGGGSRMVQDTQGTERSRRWHAFGVRP